MKAIIQRVTRASVTVGEEQISSIGRGICVLLGISMEDTQKELEHMVRKILNLRVFEDESGKHWSKSVMDKQYEVLCVSQFTLQCILKGNKPDYHMAMPTEQAETFYNNFLAQLRKAYKPELIKDGKFGAYMQVHIQNDGPVTIELESPVAAAADPKQSLPNTELALTMGASLSMCMSLESILPR
ncbi:D-aminoacyl-tRNA deacylase 1 isoform X3 [Notamacropus eugenii]|uniref:D-aminoacyl-tRNA deacylase 1 isoform X3 n=1 Tax=Notamacropus eugenii TaxID=9315 RepID=UPI003B6824A5